MVSSHNNTHNKGYECRIRERSYERASRTESGRNNGGEWHDDTGVQRPWPKRDDSDHLLTIGREVERRVCIRQAVVGEEGIDPEVAGVVGHLGRGRVSAVLGKVIGRDTPRRLD